jgi:hypothetical protein
VFDPGTVILGPVADVVVADRPPLRDDWPAGPPPAEPDAGPPGAEPS